MFLVVRRKTLVFCAILFTALALGWLLLPSAAQPTMAEAKQGNRTVVIDAGHGGEDGGAVAASGVAESGINLAIAQRLNALLQFLGEDTVMTRREDVSIHSADALTLRQKKASDLKNRVELVNGIPGAVLISIHQNSLPSSPRVHGAQVFYAATEQSDALAASVQRTLNEHINIGNEKHEKQIDPSIYLMKHVTCPAILVECGFLSNPQEAERLQGSAYQQQLAICIAAGFLSADRCGPEREAP